MNPLSRLVVLALVLSLSVQAKPEGKEGATGIKVTSELQKQLGIRVAPVKLQALATGVEATGRIEALPERTIDINAPIAGQLIEVRVRKGQAVARGQILAVLDSSEIRQLAVETEQQEGQIQADLVRLTAQVQLARQTLEREQELLAAKVSAAKNLELAKANLATIQAEQRAVRSRLRLVRAPLTARLAQLGSGAGNGLILLRAKEAGFIAFQEAAAGEAVEPGRKLFQVVDTAKVWATADIYEKDLPMIRQGQPVAMRITALPGKAFKGTLSIVDPIVDAEARTVQVHAVLNNAQGQLKPGMFANLQLQTGRTAPVPVIPTSALVEVGGQQLVYMQREGNFESVVVQVGQQQGDQVAIRQGLKAGDSVVVAGAFLLQGEALKAAGASFGSGEAEHDHAGEEEAKAESGTDVKGEQTPSNFPLWIWGLVAGGVGAGFGLGLLVQRGNKNKGAMTNAQ